MFQLVIGHSDDIDSLDAAEELLATCREQLADRTPGAGLLYCSSDYEPDVILACIAREFPGLPLIGCTTDGEMSSQLGFSEDSVTLALFVSGQVEFSVGIGTGASVDAAAAAREAHDMARAGLTGEPRLAITMPDGLTSSAFDVLAALNTLLGPDVPVVGGMSADRVESNKTDYATYQFCNGQIHTDAVPLLLFGGGIRFALGVESGWKPVGKPMTVTRVEGNLLHEVDGQPAFELYRHYLGEATADNLAGLGAYPLAVYETGQSRYYLRVANHVDPETGAMRFLGEIPHGATVQITQAVRDDVVSGAGNSVRQAMADYPGDEPAAALLFSCTGRKLALGTRTGDEVAQALDAVTGKLPMCGFYTFGEIGPLSARGSARYHNTTFVTLLLGDR